jgi:2-methylcitrate dehydratase PrpD
MSVKAQANPSRLHGLASWATSLRYEDIPPGVIDRTKDFFLDTLACTLGGRDHAAIIALVELTKKMGPYFRAL